MPATKILNISKSDTFEEIFDLFQNAPAEEVILIIPKASKLAKQEAHFTVLKKEADNSGKSISIMTEDPAAERLAKLSGIQILAGASSTKSKSKKQPQQNVVTETVVEDAPVPLEEDTYPEPEEYPEAVLTAAPVRSQRKTMDDVIKEEPESTIPVKEDKKVFKIDVHREEISPSKPIDKIEAIWSHQRNEEQYDDKIEKSSANRQARLRYFRNIFKRGSSGGRASNSHKWPIIVIGFAVIIFGIVAYITMGSAQIAIEVKKADVDFKLSVVTSPNFYDVDTSTGQIPGQQFSIQKEVSDIFPATGQKTVAQKARGRIQIFNNNIGKSQRLVATTRFESESGLIFRIPATITVPGATKTADGKIAPGSIESDVFADKPGSEYNIGPSSFTIPGFKDLPQYTQFSALSVAAMTGGIIGPSKVVTEDDFIKAQQDLEQRLKDSIVTGLKDKILDLKIISQNNIKIEAPVTNAKAGEAANELKMTLRGSIDTIAFREKDLAFLIDNYSKNNSGFDQERSQLVKEFSDELYDSASAKLSFTIHVSGTGAARLDQDKITSDILGMSQDAIKTYFNATPEIGSVKIILSPFWVKNIPRDAKRIKLTVE